MSEALVLSLLILDLIESVNLHLGGTVRLGVWMGIVSVKRHKKHGTNLCKKPCPQLNKIKLYYEKVMYKIALF